MKTFARKFVSILAALSIIVPSTFAPLTAMAATSGTLQTSANGDYTSWENGESQIDETSNFSCNSGDYIREGTTNARESFTVSLASIPNGSTLESAVVTVRDEDDSDDSGTGGTYQTFVRINGVNTDAGANLSATAIGSCSSPKSQTIDFANLVKSGATTFEIGVLKTGADTDTVRVGTITVDITYTEPIVNTIDSLVLVNSTSDTDIDTIDNGDVYNYDTIGVTTLSIRANATPSTDFGSVVFNFDGGATVNDHTENDIIWTANGNIGSDYADISPILAIGEHTVTVTPYTGANGTGTAGNSLTRTFKIIRNEAGRCTDEIDNDLDGNVDSADSDCTGSITIHKNVLASSGDETSDSHLFSITLNGDNTQSVGEGADYVYAGLTPGVYSVSENVDPNYDFMSFSVDADPELTGAQVTVVAGATTELTITNKQKPSEVPTGSIQITKYDCPADTVITRSANGVAEGDTVPAGCTTQSGVHFGYVHGTGTDANGPYDDVLGEGVTHEVGGTTNEDGVLTLSGLPATGRYLVYETNSDYVKLSDSEILNLYCEGDGDTNDASHDNQELTFVTNGGVAKCVAYNVETEVNQCSDGNDNDEDGFTDYNVEGGDAQCSSPTDNNEGPDMCTNLEGDQSEIPEGYHAGVESELGMCIADGGSDNDEDTIIECTDGVDNDANELIDAEDPMCSSVLSNSATVLVKKHVINDGANWGKVASDFIIKSIQDGSTVDSFNGSEGGTLVIMLSELDDEVTMSYSFTEDGDEHYEATFSEGCSGNIELGDHFVCTITNDDLIPSSGGGGNGGNNGNNGSVLGETTENPNDGQVLGALACSALTYEQLITIKNGVGADPEIVKALQEWLNSSQNAGLTVTGVYDQPTKFAIMLLQEKYASEVLHPWGIEKATGNVWKTTAKLIMKLICGENVEIGALVPFEVQ